MKMARLSKKDKITDYFIIFLFIITSGSVFYKINLSGSITYFLLLLLGGINKLRVSRNMNYPRIRNNNSWWFIVFVIIIATVGDLYYSHTYDDKNLLGYIIILTSAYIVISSYSLIYFRMILTDVVYIITIIGIPIFFLHELGALPTYTLHLSGGTDYRMFLIYTLGWPYIFHRYSGIWHEPGACQIILNTVLWLYYTDFVRWKWEKGVFKKVMVIALGSILTLSTGSFISLMLFLSSIALTIKIKSRYRIMLKSSVILLSILAILLMFNSEVIQNKLFIDDSQEAISKTQRMADALALYTMTTERPLLGYGLGSHNYWQTSEKLGNTGNSAGLLVFSASFGVIWLFVFIVVIYIRIRQMGYEKESLLLLLSILLMQFNENYVEYPITSIFVFKFGSYLSYYKQINQ